MGSFHTDHRTPWRNVLVRFGQRALETRQQRGHSRLEPMPQLTKLSTKITEAPTCDQTKETKMNQNNLSHRFEIDNVVANIANGVGL